MIDLICRVFNHKWNLQGGRLCPKGNSNCSQSVYRCKICKQWDYGEKTGPAYRECFGLCNYVKEVEG